MYGSKNHLKFEKGKSDCSIRIGSKRWFSKFAGKKICSPPDKKYRTPSSCFDSRRVSPGKYTYW